MLDIVKQHIQLIESTPKQDIIIHGILRRADESLDRELSQLTAASALDIENLVNQLTKEMSEA